MGGAPAVSVRVTADASSPLAAGRVQAHGRMARWLACGWPGLARLWYEGDRAALALALTAAALLNMALLITWYWTEVVGRGTSITIWGGLAAVWAGSAVHNARWLRGRTSSSEEKAGHLFRRALDQYLQGHWVEAEGLLGRLLSVAPQDGDARLLLATLLRHTRRYEQARDQLQRLLGCAGHEKWEFEVRQELLRLDEAQAGEEAPV